MLWIEKSAKTQSQSRRLPDRRKLITRPRRGKEELLEQLQSAVRCGRCTTTEREDRPNWKELLIYSRLQLLMGRKCARRPPFKRQKRAICDSPLHTVCEAQKVAIWSLNERRFNQITLTYIFTLQLWRNLLPGVHPCSAFLFYTTRTHTLRVCMQQSLFLTFIIIVRFLSKTRQTDIYEVQMVRRILQQSFSEPNIKKSVMRLCMPVARSWTSALVEGFFRSEILQINISSCQKIKKKL